MSEEQEESRVLCWFSCGAASTMAAHLAIQKYGDRAQILYCNTFAYEHPDNRRYLADIEKLLQKQIQILTSPNYTTIYDVFEKTHYLAGVYGARCTLELKKKVRHAYQKFDDIHIFGYTLEETNRATKLQETNPELLFDWVLIDNKITKQDCLNFLKKNKIEIPTMYKLGYKNNNCIGCVKGQSGYWNKIRRDFPDIFERMSKLERKLNVALNKKYVHGKRIRIFLDELPPNMGRYESEADISCGPLCTGETT